ncbi:MAG: alpha-aminoadipate/glutamate carrier protein LysW/ArgW [Aigarchaeota archaeon]|nr:alpha-aminoadipate/glutamate carrier protein LysW/ArgW [Candidatus Pelearchaeum maunauluense]
MPELSCPVCGGTMAVPEDALAGELFEHGDCGAQLELIVDDNGSMSLKMAEEVAEDWGE